MLSRGEKGRSLASGRGGGGGGGRDAGSRSLWGACSSCSCLRARGTRRRGRGGGGDAPSGEEPERGLPGSSPCFRDGPGLGGDGRGGDGEGANKRVCVFFFCREGDGGKRLSFFFFRSADRLKGKNENTFRSLSFSIYLPKDGASAVTHQLP